jgi:antitoxin (DNA-binding transcriptional repressor) of toxin-antitoxin stability system
VVSAKIIDVTDTPFQLLELLEQVAGGMEILLTEGSIPRARLVPVGDRLKVRVPGLHAGSMTIRSDFDEPLPEEFWAGPQS